ncbi:hypothetical protein GALL_423690 [mine drainage metagenome]|uniref:Uncharacterized protein n=1 Tax=mine drainage metagenome TaxID=410659 RepID=A0A1J5PYE7_9ZZZZ
MGGVVGERAARQLIGADLSGVRDAAGEQPVEGRRRERDGGHGRAAGRADAPGGVNDVTVIVLLIEIR